MKRIDPNSTASPCIKVCTLDFDDICLGCFRHISEITGWHNATDDEKRAIMQKVVQRQQAALEQNQPSPGC